MKRILVNAWLLGAFLISDAFAQKDGNYNYSIGVRSYTLMQLPKLLSETDKDNFTATPLYGGLLKINDNQISYRISVNYLDKEKAYKNNCSNCEFYMGRTKDFEAKIGFEKNINYSVIQPYLGFDMGYRLTRFGGTQQQANNANTYNVDFSKSGFTFGPILGFKINTIKQVSLFAETSLNLFYAYERQESTQTNAPDNKIFNKYNKLEVLYNPISIGLQIHLVEKN